jgi:hypothetical protein
MNRITIRGSILGGRKDPFICAPKPKMLRETGFVSLTDGGILMRKHWAAAIAACIAICSVDFVRAQGPDWGKNEYLTACQPCHGKDGKGDGSTASHLARRPADLTKLSESTVACFHSCEFSR